jgi:hypothetical protein
MRRSGMIGAVSFRGGTERMVLYCAAMGTGSDLEGWRREDGRRVSWAGLRVVLPGPGDGIGAVCVDVVAVASWKGDEGWRSVEFFRLRGGDGVRISIIWGNGNAFATCAWQEVSVGVGSTGCSKVASLNLFVSPVGVEGLCTLVVLVLVFIGPVCSSVAWELSSTLLSIKSIEPLRGGGRGSFSRFRSRLRFGLQLGL